MPAINSVKLQREQFFVLSQGIHLEAELVIPAGGDEPKAAVIFLPGSGSRPFQNYIPGFFETIIEAVFLHRDMCILYMNKRGVGESEGHWQKNDFPGRADDMYAAVKHLQGHAMIDPGRIGLIGHSQGGWIANLAAAQHEDIAFFISLAGPTTTVEEQIRHTVEIELACKGLKGEKFKRRVWWQMLQTKTAAVIGKIFPFGDLGHIARILHYDPREAIKGVHCPGLFVFAGLDSYVPAKENMERYDEIFHDGPPENLSTVVIENTDHLFHLTDTVCFDWEQSIRKLYSKELVAVLEAWLTEHGY